MMKTKNKVKEKKVNDKIDYNPDITKEDLNALGKKTEHLRTDGGQDAYLKNREKPVDFEGKNLDIPGRADAKFNSKGNLTDEENRHHSLGSSENSNLENNIEK